MLASRRQNVALRTLLVVLGAWAGWCKKAPTPAPREVLSPPWPEHHIPDGTPFELPRPRASWRDIYVDAQSGNDRNSGESTGEAMRTLAAAWAQVPRGRLIKGHRIILMPGSYGDASWEGRWGSVDAPIILTTPQGGDWQSSATSLGALRLINCSSVYLVGLTLLSAEPNTLYIERCVGVYLRGMRVASTLAGAINTGDSRQALLAVQAADLFIEDSEVAGAGSSALVLFAVQYSHVLRSEVHDATSCFYVLGGSAYHLIDGNTVYNCGDSGLSAGYKVSVFQYMVPPWIQYEAYSIRITNNLVRDVRGAGLGVWGSYQVLVAHNTLLRVGALSHAVDFNLGLRMCPPSAEQERCVQLRAAGGWGPDTPSATNVILVPSRDVYFLNNVVYNPLDQGVQDYQLRVELPYDNVGSGIPGEQVRVDDSLVIAGNVFWSGAPDTPLAPFDGQGCPETASSPFPPEQGAAAPFCLAPRILPFNLFRTDPGVDLDSDPAKNAIVVPPGPEARVPPGSLLALSPLLVAPLYAFPPWSAQTGAPPGSAPNEVPLDILGRVRAGGFNAIGAYAVQGAPSGMPPPVAVPEPSLVPKRPPSRDKGEPQAPANSVISGSGKKKKNQDRGRKQKGPQPALKPAPAVPAPSPNLKPKRPRGGH